MYGAHLSFGMGHPTLFFMVQIDHCPLGFHRNSIAMSSIGQPGLAQVERGSLLVFTSNGAAGNWHPSQQGSEFGTSSCQAGYHRPSGTV
jgi:hypothetical protein